MSGRAKCVILWLGLFNALKLCSGTCLPASEKPIPKEQRRNISVAGEFMPLGIVYGTWASSFIEHQIYKIIVEEKLGYNTKSLGFDTSEPSFYTVSGCRCGIAGDCKTDPECGQMNTSEWHVALGIWKSYAAAARDYVQGNVEAQYPANLGELGYPARDAMWIPQGPLAEAFRVVETPLEYYKVYNTSTDISHFFDGVGAITANRLMPCEKTNLWNHLEIKSYVEFTGDKDGVAVDSNGFYHGVCHAGHWWLSPSCRANASRCIPLITGGNGWGYKQWMIKATSYGMPLAIGVASNYADYLSIPLDYTTLLYWWYPDPAFTTRRPTELIFPEHNKLEWAAGNTRTSALNDPIEKFAWEYFTRRSEVGPDFIQVARSLELTQQQIDQFIVQYVELSARTENAGRDGEDLGYMLACGWMKQNRVVWETWIPLATQCLSGQGLVGGNADFVQNRSGAVACEWCSPGRYSVPLPKDIFGITFICLPCLSGEENIFGGQVACTKCQPGRFKAQLGTQPCEKCPAGQATQFEGQTSCQPCAPGFVAARKGELKCSACPVGTAEPQRGSVLCSLCEVGKFSNISGSVNCSYCSLVLADSTSARGSSRSSECICPEGSYRPLGGDSCVACPTGMICVAGSNMVNFQSSMPSQQGKLFPKLQAGYYSTPEQPLSVFRCLASEDCPGGMPGTCSRGLVGLNCAHCPDGQALEKEACSVCKFSAGPFLIIAFVPIVSVGISVMHVLSNWPMVKGQKMIMNAVFFLGMAITVVLTFGVYSTLDAVWGPPLRNFTPSFSILSLDLEILNLSCLIGGGSYLSPYIIKLITFPACCIILILAVSMLHCIPKMRLLANFNRPALVNSIGFLLSAFFVSVSLVSLEGLRCSSNPNGLSTLSADASIICWKGGDHLVIVALSCAAILVYPVPFISLTGFATFSFGHMSTRYGLSFTRSVRFLTGRMKPGCEVFGFWFNVRNFLISVAPVIATNNYGAQVCLILAAFLVWIVLQARYECWRFESLNMLDTIISAAQIMLLALFGLLGAESVDAEIVGWCIILVLSAIVLLLFMTALWKVTEHFCKKSNYDVFLTHHKAAAALAARHLKTLFMSIGSNLNVFLDVDELDNLDNIGFAVKRTHRLIIMLTDDVLRRPWCAVEIGTAFLNQVSLGVVQINDDEVKLTKDFLAAVMGSFTQADCTIFAKAGITMDCLSRAYDYVAGIDKVNLPLAMPNTGLQLEALKSAVGKHVLQLAKAPPALATDPEKGIYIIYSIASDAQASVAYILGQLFRAKRWSTRIITAEFTEVISQKAVAVVLMSRTIIADSVALGGVVAVARAGLGAVTVWSQESFFKPSDEFFGNLRDNKVLSEVQMQQILCLAPGSDGKELADALQPMYKSLAWSFSPEQNKGSVNQEFSIVEELANKELQRRLEHLES